MGIHWVLCQSSPHPAICLCRHQSGLELANMAPHRHHCGYPHCFRPIHHGVDTIWIIPTTRIQVSVAIDEGGRVVLLEPVRDVSYPFTLLVLDGRPLRAGLTQFRIQLLEDRLRLGQQCTGGNVMTLPRCQLAGVVAIMTGYLRPGAGTPAPTGATGMSSTTSWISG